MRYFFEVSYHGKNYHGWQRQPNSMTVQEEIEEKLSLLLGEKVEITGSGRTDAGVHCSQQYFHTDINSSFNKDLLHKINSFLPDSVFLNSFHPVSDDKHARFDAILRRYHYKVLTKRNPFLLDTSYLFFRPLEIEQMNQAAKFLIGKHDFQVFSKVKTDVTSFECEIFEAEWKKDGELLTFDIAGNRFLRGMVRAIVGTLLEVGEGKRTIDDFQSLMQSRDRREAGKSVPSHGLTLMEVRYPDGYFE